MKESMFAVIDHHKQLTGAHVLDLFAGSGQLAWESLSRGASSATLIDSSTDVCRHLRSVAIDFGVSDRVTIIRSDVLMYLRQGDLSPADLVFLDPPYHIRACNTIVQVLLQRDILAPGALVVVEHGDQEALLPDDRLTSLWHRERSSTVVDILNHPATEP